MQLHVAEAYCWVTRITKTNKAIKQQLTEIYNYIPSDLLHLDYSFCKTALPTKTILIKMYIIYHAINYAQKNLFSS